MNSVKKVEAREGLGAEVGEGSGTGHRAGPELVGWEKRRWGWLSSLASRGSRLSSFGYGAPLVVVSITLGVLGEGPTIAASADNRRLKGLPGGEVSAPWPACLLLDSLFAISATGSLILGPEPGNSNVCECYRAAWTLGTSALARFIWIIGECLHWHFGVAFRMEGGQGVAGISGTIVGQPEREGLFEKRDGL